MDSDWHKLCRLAFDMTGGNTDNPTNAFSQWQEERQGMREIHDQNEALKISSRRLVITLEIAERAINAMEADAGMFVRDATRKIVAQFREQMRKAKTSITISKEIIDEPPF